MTETRRSRSSFTSALKTICQRLDANPEQLIRWKHPLVGTACARQFTIRSLWAVGSYARGAPDCGDLDLLAEIVSEDRLPPPERMVATAIIQGAKDVNLHIGTPVANTSEVEFPEARLIWRGRGCDWRAAIESIKVAPSAGHYVRPMDRIPLRPAQLRCDIEDLEALLDQEERQIIRWKFTPTGEMPDIGQLNEEEIELSQAIDRHCGRRTHQLLPHLIAYLRQSGGWPKPYLRANFNKMMIGIGGAKVLTGRPTVPTYELDWLTTSELLIMPHISARGPNGIWSIERGNQHPLVVATSKLRVYALFGADDLPDFHCRTGEDYDGGPCDSSTAKGIDLFTSLRSARKWNQQCVEDGDPNLIAKRLTPHELLSCLARVDIASIDLTDFAMTRRGQVALGHSRVTTTQEVLQELAG